MKYIPIPVALMEIGTPLPVDIWSDSGSLLLRKGQAVISEQHREKLRARQACATQADAETWRSYANRVQRLLESSLSPQEAGPSTLQFRDKKGRLMTNNNWQALNEALQGISYQAELTSNPLRRLADIKVQVLDLVDSDPDDSLFCLFQAMADEQLSYSATHALQCAVVCKLTADKMDMPLPQSESLVNAALTMNMGMAREQDQMARQITALSTEQKSIIFEHPQKSVAILRNFGVSDEDQIDLVRWHHSSDAGDGLAQTRARRQILVMADKFLAKMAARKTRSPLSSVAAIKSIVMDVPDDSQGLGSAMAQAVSFYPPGSYVKLVNGDTAVSVRRGARANTPWVIGIIDQDGMPISRYQCRDTAQPAYAIAGPLDFEKVRVAVSLEKMRKARADMGR
jgi:HD-GYP domain-containing protein (c-di-GMP phosphodiesterase class II)